MLNLPPGMLMIVGALLFPFLRGRATQIWLVLLPVISGLQLLQLPHGIPYEWSFLGYTLQPIRIDDLSLVWGYIFHIAAFLSAIYAWGVKDRGQHVAALMYAGSAIGGVFAGDLITLFIYWELTAISSVFLIWATRTERAYRAGMRYVTIQVLSGVILLAGVLMRLAQGHGLTFEKMGLNDMPTLLIFLAFGIKAAFPLLHGWLKDAYPEATPTGTVFLSAFTTKMAIYALARGFPGTELLIYIGAVMTAFPIFMAVIVNDLRRVLSYSLNNQLGFMVVGVGLGTEMALNGTAAHAFAHILYKGVLFMSMGAVLMQTGTCNGSELGGLYKRMPKTAWFCMIGAAAISAFPLFSGFVTKSLILSATAENHYTWVWFVLLFASAGVFHHSGIKIPYFAFFSGHRYKNLDAVQEAPRHMLIAMGLTAFLCVAIGVFPAPLYEILPYEVDYHPYTTAHVINQLQLLLFSALAFTVLNLLKVYPPELRSVNLDVDWIYRRFLPRTVSVVGRLMMDFWNDLLGLGRRLVFGIMAGAKALNQPGGLFFRTWTSERTAFWVALLLSLYLLISLSIGIGP